LHILLLTLLLAATTERGALVAHTDTVLAELCWPGRWPVLLALLGAVGFSAISSLAAAARLLQVPATRTHRAQPRCLPRARTRRRHHDRHPTD
jgi:hypothetical protein